MVHLLALAAAAFYGAADFTGGVAARSVTAVVVVLVSQGAGLLMLAVLMPFLADAAPIRSDLIWGVAAGISGGVGVALLYRALAIGAMAVVAPTTAVCAVTIPVVVAIVLGERPGMGAGIGIVLGIVSILLVSQQPASDPNAEAAQAAARRRGLGTALASGVAIGFFLLSLAQTRAEAGMWPLLVSRATTVTLFTLIAAATRPSFQMTAGVALLAAGGGTLDMAANIFYLIAVREGPMSVVVTLASLYPASTVLLARIVLGERLGLVQVAGVMCALAAVLLIVSGT
jgi:uncharacterized membrane protein